MFVPGLCRVFAPSRFRAIAAARRIRSGATAGNSSVPDRYDTIMTYHAATIPKTSAPDEDSDVRGSPFARARIGAVDIC